MKDRRIFNILLIAFMIAVLKYAQLDQFGTYALCICIGMNLQQLINP